MKKTIFFTALISILLFASLLFISPSYAQLIEGEALTNLQENTNQVRVLGGFSGNANVGSIVASIIRTALSLLALIFLVLVVFSGFQWMTAAGNESKIEKAQETIKAALIGLIIVLAAYAITYFIFTYLPFTASTDGANNNGGFSVSP